MQDFKQAVDSGLERPGGNTLNDLYALVSHAAMDSIAGRWAAPKQGKCAAYFSAEFLIGRMVYSNLLNLGLLEDLKAVFDENGLDPTMFEDVEDAALGNGGLGRLAACFLDSAATEGLRLDGFGIRYKYGLFKQYFENGFQKEAPDDWQRFGDPWSVRREEEKILIEFGDSKVWAVPYDMPVIGYGGETVNTLRLWQAEALHPFNFEAFNDQAYDVAYTARNSADAIHSVLYPNDDTDVGKRLRLKQQYFFSSASLQCILARFKEQHGADWDKLPGAYAIQLNDTHPTIAIPELLRLLMSRENLSFDEAFGICKRLFAYTNHTILAEALETWDASLFMQVAPQVYPYVVMLNDHLRRTLVGKGIPAELLPGYEILAGGRVHMARMAIYATLSTNGVAALHTEILKETALGDWYRLFPERFNNKTNGITQRRWLALANPELSALITERIGDGWVRDLSQLEKLRPMLDDTALQDAFLAVKATKKQQLAWAIARFESIEIDPASVFDIQVKRLHEYKRQLLNAFSILDMYFQIKEGKLQDLPPVTFLFGAKAAPGYFRAKGIIKLINEIGKLVDADPAVREKLRVVFVQNYNVSYAERLIPAADLSEQISTAGTEASGTGNMKLMLNGAPTIGTYDGANIEIVNAAGEANEYIFGATVEDIASIDGDYDPAGIMQTNPRIRRVVDALIDGTLSDDGTGMFSELYDSLVKGASWHEPDHYYLLLDFEPYVDTKLRALRDYTDRHAWAKKCLANIASAGHFSSDRTIREYAEDIWGLI